MAFGPRPQPRPVPQRQPAHASPPETLGYEGLEEDGPLVDQGRPLALRLLALLGALSFVLLGISSVTPLLEPVAPPPVMPDQREGSVG
jgi:hypothetical protein